MSDTERDDDPERDDDALSWEGDDDRTYVSRRKPDARPAATPPAAEAAKAEPKPEPAVAAAGGDAHWALGETPEEQHPPVGNVALVAFGVLGGVYALLTIGWIVGALRLQGYALFFIAPVAYQVSMWLAVLAPAAWFTAVALLTRSARIWVRFLLLVAGALLLLPWPFIMVGAVGA
ncbi:DNA polymerase III subunit gamma/tau [Microbacterium sp. X-17]|uniref:DNA polymerase III subunit gamma/tau n=1 Tax=Microbacterium sp. X-17 TaxID=3144404 RepID=UPI0031F5BFCE